MSSSKTRGHAAIEYMLTLAVLVLGLVAVLHPYAKGLSLKDACIHWFRDLALRVVKP